MQTLAGAQVCRRRRSSVGERKREPVVPPQCLEPPYPQHASAELCHLGVSFAVSEMASARSPAVFAEKLKLTVLWLLLAKRHFIQVLIK